ncbi:MAG TPA: GNAT family N-acetyltransferase [Candidatus Limnocylindria bacterium]|nr:GNAT family N-acetyltransferase [Candidatus Limnocylindria bacterium]
MVPSAEYFLKTPRLGFRCWSADDLPHALALWGDIQVTQFIGGPFAPEKVKERLANEIASMNSRQVQYWPLFLLSSGDHAGCGGLRPYKPEDSVYEMGIHLRRRFWGQGLAEEAGRAIIHYAFNSLGARGLFAGHNPANSASQKLLSKLGFRFTHEEFYPPTGLMHPSYLLSAP